MVWLFSSISKTCFRYCFFFFFVGNFSCLWVKYTLMRLFTCACQLLCILRAPFLCVCVLWERYATPRWRRRLVRAIYERMKALIKTWLWSVNDIQFFFFRHAPEHMKCLCGSAYLTVISAPISCFSLQCQSILKSQQEKSLNNTNSNTKFG